MKASKFLLVAAVFLILNSGFSAKGLASGGVAPDGDDSSQYAPIPELQTQKPVDDYSIFDDVRIHIGVAMINSFQDIPLAAGVRSSATAHGVELNLGVDMFSPHWIVEGVLDSLPETAAGDARFSTNGFELRALYDTAIFEAVTVHLGLGVANRNYNIKTAARADGSVKASDTTFQSGATVLAAGIDYWPNANVSAGVEVTDHAPMASGDDPSSLDMAVKVTGHF
jgi:hypothetical protein